jgi:hypothetical protein
MLWHCPHNRVFVCARADSEFAGGGLGITVMVAEEIAHDDGIKKCYPRNLIPQFR